MPSNQPCLVLTTCPNEASARSLGDTLVEQRLAACVSVGAPVESRFPWEGRIDTEREYPLTIKTLQGRLDQLEETLARIHPYDVPEILVLPVLRGNQAYLDWMKEWING